MQKNTLIRDEANGRLTYTINQGADAMPVLALKPHPDGAQRGSTNLGLGDGIFSRVDLATWPIKGHEDKLAPAWDKGHTEPPTVCAQVSVVMAEGRPPEHPDDPLLSGVQFGTSAATQSELLDVVQEFLRQRLEANVNILRNINCSPTTEKNK